MDHERLLMRRGVSDAASSRPRRHQTWDGLDPGGDWPDEG